MDGTIVNNTQVANEKAADIINKSSRFSLENIGFELDCTNASVDTDCEDCYAELANFVDGYSPCIENLTSYIQAISESMEEKDKGFFR